MKKVAILLAISGVVSSTNVLGLDKLVKVQSSTSVKAGDMLANGLDRLGLPTGSTTDLSLGTNAGLLDSVLGNKGTALGAGSLAGVKTTLSNSVRDVSAGAGLGSGVVGGLLHGDGTLGAGVGDALNGVLGASVDNKVDDSKDTAVGLGVGKAFGLLGGASKGPDGLSLGAGTGLGAGVEGMLKRGDTVRTVGTSLEKDLGLGATVNKGNLLNGKLGDVVSAPAGGFLQRNNVGPVGALNLGGLRDSLALPSLTNTAMGAMGAMGALGGVGAGML